MFCFWKAVTLMLPWLRFWRKRETDHVTRTTHLHFCKRVLNSHHVQKTWPGGWYWPRPISRIVWVNISRSNRLTWFFFFQNRLHAIPYLCTNLLFSLISFSINNRSLAVYYWQRCHAGQIEILKVKKKLFTRNYLILS
jgi:hypothetical protein